MSIATISLITKWFLNEFNSVETFANRTGLKNHFSCFRGCSSSKAWYTRFGKFLQCALCAWHTQGCLGRTQGCLGHTQGWLGPTRGCLGPTRGWLSQFCSSQQAAVQGGVRTIGLWLEHEFQTLLNYKPVAGSSEGGEKEKPQLPV